MASRAVVWRPLAYNDSRKFSLPFEVQAFMTEEKRRSGQSLNRDRLDVTNQGLRHQQQWRQIFILGIVASKLLYQGCEAGTQIF